MTKKLSIFNAYKDFYISQVSNSRNTNIEDINFEQIGNECLSKINGEYIKEKYNIEEGIAFKEKLHQERVKWMKEKFK